VSAVGSGVTDVRVGDRVRWVNVIGSYAEQAVVPATVREFTAGKGVAVAYDGVGASTFEASLSSLRPRGYLVSYGSASGPVPPVEPLRLAQAGSVFLTRPTLGHYIAAGQFTVPPAGRPRVLRPGAGAR
jgi:NADPH:quinone reductase-like Zn-dependent oxidoreductase